MTEFLNKRLTSLSLRSPNLLGDLQRLAAASLKW